MRVVARLSVVLLGVLSGCTSLGPQPIGVQGGKLQPCPAAPHCVNSDEPATAQASMDAHIEALRLNGDTQAAWQALKAHVRAIPRTTVVSERADYLHVQVRSRLMGYTDDVEFLLRPPETETETETQTEAHAAAEVAMRSCSRLGYYDFGVNRARLESLRTALRARGPVR